MDEKIARRKLSDEVFDRLMKMIEQGAIQPGGGMPSERELMARFQVGRPAVREAMQALAGMGIIHIAHGERARLNELGPKTVFEQIDRSAKHLLTTSPEMQAHLSDARMMFETGMVRLASRQAGAADIAILRECLSRMAEARGDAAKFVAADMAFHEAIAAMSGNPICMAVSAAMLNWVFEFFPRLLRIPGTEEVTVREHSLIVEAIAAGDEDQAVQSMADHLKRSDPDYSKNCAQPLRRVAPRRKKSS